MIKIAKDLNYVNAITHGGTFHSDEVLATVLIEKVLGNVIILRTFKVPEKVPDATIVYDIGGGKYDHHQRGGNGARENGVPYSSVGLIWRDFGRQLVSTCCDDPEFVWKVVDRELIQGIDAIDNGKMPQADYPAKSMSFSQIISAFNPMWDSDDKADDCFVKAVDFAKIIFGKVLDNAISMAKAKGIVERAIAKATDHIMVLGQFVPWQEYVLSSQDESATNVWFVVFPSNRGGYNWQCVPESIASFRQRKPVPAEWKGLNGLDIQKVTGVASATFCHPAGFIGGAETLEDAITLAKLAVASN